MVYDQHGKLKRKEEVAATLKSFGRKGMVSSQTRTRKIHGKKWSLLDIFSCLNERIKAKDHIYDIGRMGGAEVAAKRGKGENLIKNSSSKVHPG